MNFYKNLKPMEKFKVLSICFGMPAIIITIMVKDLIQYPQPTEEILAMFLLFAVSMTILIYFYINYFMDKPIIKKEYKIEILK